MLFNSHVFLFAFLPLTLLVNLYIFIRHRRHIDGSVLLGRILPFMGTGLVIGFGLFNWLGGEVLRKAFGILVVLVSIRELVNLMGHRRGNGTPLPGWLFTGYVFTAGLIQGVYASGGPFLVYAVNKMGLPKSVFRSTLSTVWLTMNIFLTTFYVIAGQLDLASLKFSANLLPSLVAGVWLGEYLHERVSERRFKIAAFGLLMLSGIFIMLK